MIPFNKPYISGKEQEYINKVLLSGSIGGNGTYTQHCQRLMEKRWGVKKVLLTTSCTDALEMCALLLDIAPEDEVIVPSFTFSSTGMAFARQGANLIFADSRADSPNIDESQFEQLITPKTKAIVVMHYAGVACDMDLVMSIAQKYNLFVIEDAAQAIGATYKDKQLGTIGHLGVFSFHETKNVQCGEGGALLINDDRFLERAEATWVKGVNRMQFNRGEVERYQWVALGSSFLPNELTSAFLFAQLKSFDEIQDRRTTLWRGYQSELTVWTEENNVRLPFVPNYAANNGHLFYLVCPNEGFRKQFISYLQEKAIPATFHYSSLHKSKYIESLADKAYDCPNSDRYSACLVRLPLFFDLANQEHIIKTVISFQFG